MEGASDGRYPIQRTGGNGGQRDPPIGTPLGSSWVRSEPRTVDPAYSGVCEEAEVG